MSGGHGAGDHGHDAHGHHGNGAVHKGDSGTKVVVIGGGVVGSACAYYLRKAGKDVTIVDRGKFGRGASHANCGYISPSHVLPLNKPGAIQKTLTSMFDKTSAFYLKPRIDFSLFGWMMRFAQKCNKKDMLEAGHALHPILQSSAELYKGLLAGDLTGTEHESKGMLFVFKTEKMLSEYDAVDALLREHFGVGARKIDGAELARMEPALQPGLAGAYFYDIDSHLRPDRLMSSWRRALEGIGVTILEDQPVTRINKESGKAKSVVTEKGTLDADTVVVATGAWTPKLSSELECYIPIQPGKGYSITMPRPNPCPSYPMILEEYHVAVTPFDSGYRLGSTMEFAGYNETMNRTRLDMLRRGAKEYLITPTAEPVQEEWFGWRPMCADSVPIIDRTPGLSNVYLATGHSMLGVTLAPATGKLVSELVLGEHPHIDAKPYRVTRFS
jgi:D-amino-acid dehydrogenase